MRPANSGKSNSSGLESEARRRPRSHFTSSREMSFSCSRTKWFRNASFFLSSSFSMDQPLLFDSDCLAVDGLRPHPSVRPAAIVPDQKSLAVLGLDEMKIVATVDVHEDHVAYGHVRRLDRGQRHEIPVIHLALHGMASRPDLAFSASLEGLDRVLSPAHRGSSEALSTPTAISAA